MNLKINGTIKPYYVQTLAMIFCPGERFPETVEEGEDAVWAILDLDEGETGVSASVILRQGDHEEIGTSVRNWTDDREKDIKIAAGDAFMKAGTAFTGFTPPWGILTGVRPAKVASELFERGYTPEEAAAVIAEEYFVTEKKSKLAAAVAASDAKLATDDTRRECSVYVGIPFCPTRCAYCSFVSYTSPNLLKLIPDYLTALARDIDNIFETIRELDMNVATIYIGGGTPTILTPDQLEEMKAICKKKVAA